MIKIIIIFIILTILSTGIVLLITLRKNKSKEVPSQINYNFQGAAYNNIIMYKSRHEKSMSVILGKYSKFTADSLLKNINELTTRLVNGQNNGYISQAAFQKTALDEILRMMKTMKIVDVNIINYDAGYMSVAVIFENNTKELYQLLMKMNIQNGLLYLDSYNATLWFKNE